MSIKDEFNEIAFQYDKQRQLLIPCYDDFYNLPLELFKYIESRDTIYKYFFIFSSTISYPAGYM